MVMMASNIEINLNGFTTVFSGYISYLKHEFKNRVIEIYFFVQYVLQQEGDTITTKYSANNLSSN